jgi:hypothetical protein
MARTLRQARGASRWLGCVLLATTLGCHEAAGQGAVVSGRTSRLRPLDQKAAALLQAGIERSATFGRLVETLERSDLIVHIETRHLPLHGRLQFVFATPSDRYLRVSIHELGRENDVVSWLAHELQHAVEIAGAREVTNQTSLRRFYERIGYRRLAGDGVAMESDAALATETAVLYEVSGTSPQKARR